MTGNSRPVTAAETESSQPAWAGSILPKSSERPVMASASAVKQRPGDRDHDPVAPVRRKSGEQRQERGHAESSEQRPDGRQGQRPSGSPDQRARRHGDQQDDQGRAGHRCDHDQPGRQQHPAARKPALGRIRVSSAETTVSRPTEAASAAPLTIIPVATIPQTAAAQAIRPRSRFPSAKVDRRVAGSWSSPGTESGQIGQRLFERRAQVLDVGPVLGLTVEAGIDHVGQRRRQVRAKVGQQRQVLVEGPQGLARCAAAAGVLPGPGFEEGERQ